MSSRDESSEPVLKVVESFVERLRRGEHPSITDYVERYPELANQIRDLLPAVAHVEGVGGPAARDESLPADQRKPAPPSEARIPSHLGDYRIIRKIGEGGMGVVYEAERVTLQNRVALKVMHPRFRSDPRFLKRFRVEARSAAGLHHTNIVSVFDFGEHDGVCYYAMQYIVGQGLDRILIDVRRLRQLENAEPRGSTNGASPHKGAHPPSLSQRLLTGAFEAPTIAAEPADPESTSATSPTITVDAASGDETNCFDAAANVEKPKSPEPVRSESHSLASRVETRYFREVARIGAHVADALHYAHSRGVLHRDIKPSNLLLDVTGNIWVTDFGLAKLEDDADRSESKELVGTLRYMAPERLRGTSDRRCDVYALGATLYEMLTLEPLFGEGDYVRLLDRINNEAPIAPRKLDSRIPLDLETIVLKAIARNPRDRFQDARELAEELRRFVEGRPVHSRPLAPHERLWRWCQRNPWLAAANGAAALLTMIVAVVATISAVAFQRQNVALGREQAQTRLNLARATKAESDLREQLVRTQRAERQSRLDLGKALLAEGAAIQRSGTIGQRFQSLERLARAVSILKEAPEGAALLPKARDHAIAALALTDVKERWSRPIPSLIGSSIDPMMDRYAYSFLYPGQGGPGDQLHEVIVRRVSDDSVLLRVAPPTFPFWTCSTQFSRDGRLLVIRYGLANGSYMSVWDVNRAVELFAGKSADVATVPVDASGSRLCYRNLANAVVVRNLESGHEREFLTSSRNVALDFTYDGQRIVVADGEWHEARSFHVIDLNSGSVVLSQPIAKPAISMAMSPDGDLIALGSGDGIIRVHDLRSGELRSELRGHSNAVVSLAFADRGDLLMSAAWDNTTRLWNASTATMLLTIPAASGLTFGPDGAMLGFVSRDGRIGVWDLAHDDAVKVLNPCRVGNRTDVQTDIRFDQGIQSARFIPGSDVVAIASWRGVHLVNINSGRALGHVPDPNTQELLVDPAGNWLVTSSEQGLYRWPVRLNHSRDSATLRIGPPQPLRAPERMTHHLVDWLPDRTGVLEGHGGLFNIELIPWERTRPWLHRGSEALADGNPRMRSIDASSDGQWVAAGGWKEAGIYIWNLPQRARVAVLPPCESPGESSFRAAFSPDSRWLAWMNHNDQGGAGLWVVQTGTWRHYLHVRTPATDTFQPPVFSPNGKYRRILLRQPDHHAPGLGKPPRGRPPQRPGQPRTDANRVQRRRLAARRGDPAKDRATV